MFCHNNKAFLYCLPKKCRQSRLKKCRNDSRLRPTNNRLWLHPKSGGYRRLWLRKTGFGTFCTCIISQTSVRSVSEPEPSLQAGSRYSKIPRLTFLCQKVFGEVFLPVSYIWVVPVLKKIFTEKIK